MEKNNKKISRYKTGDSEEKTKNIELGLYSIKEVFEKEILEGDAKFIMGSIRSGNKIIYNGSIVVIGDVNAGAEIIAGENIIVLGELRGLAHAGAKGNRKAIVAAENIISPQLRIANILWENEENNLDNNIKKYAFVENEIIKINSN